MRTTPWNSKAKKSSESNAIGHPQGWIEGSLTLEVLHSERDQVGKGAAGRIYRYSPFRLGSRAASRTPPLIVLSTPCERHDYGLEPLEGLLDALIAEGVLAERCRLAVNVPSPLCF